MSHLWDTGFMVRKPSWHREEEKSGGVLAESPRSWEEARYQAGLTWDVETYPLASVMPSNDPAVPQRYRPLVGYRELYRSDNGAHLSVQPDSYRIVNNSEFGAVIDAALGLEDDERVNFEALMSLAGGKSVVALAYFEKPLRMPWDPSKTYTFCCFHSRHDGNGGLRIIPTDIRVQCWNTLNGAERTDGKKVGMTLRHTANFKERLAEVRRNFIIARGEGEKWVEFAEQLALWKATPRRRDDFLKKMFPVSDDNGKIANDNAMKNRTAVRTILSSDSCKDIADTGYGLLMATTEWNDHFRGTRNGDTYVARQLLQKEPHKARAASILRSQARITL